MAGPEFTTTVSAEGRVVLPNAIRERMGWGVGTRLAVEQTATGVLLTRVRPVFPPMRPEDVFGCLGPVRESKSVEEMEVAITEEAKQQYKSGDS